MALGHVPALCCFFRATVILFAAMLWALLVPMYCRAEGVTIAGLSFPVDSIVGVNESDVTVRLGGRETVIRRSDLERFVVEETLADRSLTLRLDPRALLRFAEESLKSGQNTRAGLALRAVRWRPGINEEEALETFEVLKESGASRRELAAMAQVALVPVFEPDWYPRLTACLIILVGSDDPVWVRQHAVPYTYGIKPAIQDRLEHELADRLRLRDLEGGGDLVRFSRAVYGSEDPLSQRLALWLERVRNIVDAVDRGNIDALGKALVVESSDPNLGAVLGPLAMEGLHKAATVALDAGDPVKALDILTRVDLLKRTQTTHELTRTALERLTPQQGALLQRPDVFTYLDFISRNDPGLAELYREKLLARISFLLDEDKVGESEALLDRVRLLSASSSAAIDRVLVRQAEVYLSQGLHSAAERKIRESGAAGPAVWWLRCRLSIAMMSAATMGAFLAIFFTLVALLFLSIVRGSRPTAEAAGAESAQIAPDDAGGGREDSEDDEEAPRGFVVSELRRLSPSAQEYQRYLEMLGLTATADLRSIKNAYRKLVKDVHPDRTKASDEAAANRFIELTRVYDRILELRKEFGYED